MKKEIIVGLLLVFIFSVALVNIHALDRLTGDVVKLVEESEKNAAAGKWVEAAAKAEEAEKKWSEKDSYTHLVLRHAEINMATDAIYELLKEIYSEDIGGVKGAAKAGNAHMTSISSIEHIKLGSIF
jgi:hypothetical protein